MSDSEDPIDPIDEGGDDLFGDEPDEVDEAPASPKEHVLDDDELASDPEGDDQHGRYDQHDYGAQDEDEVRERMVVDVTAYRHPVPKPTDGVLRVLRVPKFIRLHPEEYRPDSFEPSELDIANAKQEHPQQVVRFRRDADTGRLHSNANLLRWSDGSVTVSVGGEQYEIQKKPLAPPPGKAYNELQDAHYYAAAAELSSNMLMTVGHVTEQYSVRPNKDVGDEALNRLADSMALASKMAQNSLIIRTTVDPELQKKKAEQLEKERLKAQRRQENAQARQDFGMGRSSGRGGGGLSIGALEGGGRRKRAAPGGPKQPRKRRPDYDSDDDLPPGGGGHQEKYDLDDGFLVDSDEEEEEESGAGDDDDDDDDDMLDDEAPSRSKRQRTAEADEDGDEDASGDDVETAPEAVSRSRRRNVVDDDDE
ncbi:hypothetical protein GMORB2_5689 [Geosmithia morbida]|uniref:RNA polymerase-associated protein LEO1 n=1 Tax=Geosmithia morbida TaxID=1094350 RepID=A0A9P4YYF1_9HYPO|nr:uncharacterized protein GMORB2_5689 [Geosmithia morbida]KAF4123973.1 hypothetical protein GMORB2_5689 [Geosmithia morbida]